MECILDTHALIYLLNEPERLSSGLISELKNAEVYVSAATIWEISIKVGLSKLKLPSDFFEYVEDLEFEELPISSAHSRKISDLEPIHTDPFDRIIVAQALVENLEIVTNDSMIPRYAGVSVRW
jgi:PIN domain nuclease of toxin-antitoxin system